MRTFTYTCDRCKKTYKPYKSRSGFMGVQAFKKDGVQRNEDGSFRPIFRYGIRKYLCPSCMEEMESWMFEEKDLEPEEPDDGGDYDDNGADFQPVEGETPFDE